MIDNMLYINTRLRKKFAFQNKKWRHFILLEELSQVNKMYITRVLALLPLFVVMAHSFSWDIVVCEGKQLQFYKNGKIIHTVDNPSSKEIYSVTYDPVHYRVLFVDHHSTSLALCSLDLTTNKIQTLLTRLTSAERKYLAYDPLSQLLFWTEEKNMYSLSLKAASSNEAVDGNLLVTCDDVCRALAVDSCGGYIYWATEQKIERAAFDGSERQVLIDKLVFFRLGLAIDVQTQKLYWIESENTALYIIYADLNGNNRKTLYFKNKYDSSSSLAISKDFIYWNSYHQKAILQLPKNEQLDVEPIVYTTSSRHAWNLQRTAANYTILEQTRGTKVCEALKSLIPKAPVTNTSDVGLLNVTKVSEESCSACQHYCLKGNCSVSAEGHPECSCEAGYSGERCEVNACYKHCLHGGVCSLNEEDEPVCQCTAEYEGDRCDVATSHTGACVCADQTTQQILLEVKQVREDLQCTLQLYSDKLDENAAKIQICEETLKDIDGKL